MSTVSTITDGAEDEALGRFIASLSNEEKIGLLDLLGPKLLCSALASLGDEFNDRLTPDLAARLGSYRDVERAGKRARADVRAAAEGLRLCAQAPNSAFAELGPHVSVYCSTSGGPNYVVDDESSSDTSTFSWRGVGVTVKYDGKRVVRFTDWNNTASTQQITVTMSEGVPLTEHDWRAATRAYLLEATPYFDHAPSPWSSTSSASDRKRTRSPSASSDDRSSKRSRASSQ